MAATQWRINVSVSTIGSVLHVASPLRKLFWLPAVGNGTKPIAPFAEAVAPFITADVSSVKSLNFVGTEISTVLSVTVNATPFLLIISMTFSCAFAGA